jgi:hypothetical protein
MGVRTAPTTAVVASDKREPDYHRKGNNPEQFEKVFHSKLPTKIFEKALYKGCFPVERGKSVVIWTDLSHVLRCRTDGLLKQALHFLSWKTLLVLQRFVLSHPHGFAVLLFVGGKMGVFDKFLLYKERERI